MEGNRSVLVVEDDKAIQRLLRDVLEQEGLVAHEARTARLGLSEAASRQPDLIILDLGLPDLDGKEFLRELRDWSEVPVLVLSARGSELEKVAALDRGADDYLTKPFGVPELLARLRALLRRFPDRSSAEKPSRFRFGNVSVDLSAHRIVRDGEDVHLTQMEFRLLSELVKAEGRMLTQTQLLREVWGRGHEQHTHYLRIYMGHLRRKLEDDPGSPRHLLTEIGVGCRCLCEREATSP
ncbi:MAG: response regulator [Fibrobacterota bacterium]|nr:response regulator [Fibrobacterota bacterium]QQS05785.1 MAG: response regulator [Fibrobacterota bacterium]